MKTVKALGEHGVTIYTGDVVYFDHNGRRVYIVVDEFARSCARGYECDDKGIYVLPRKRWRAKLKGCSLAA